MLSDKIKKIFSGNQRSVAVKKNIVASLGIKCVSIMVSLLIVPVTLGYVSSELYGVWLTLSSIMVWINFFDVGFTLGLKNKLAEALALKDYKTGKSLVSTTYLVMFTIFLPFAIILELAIPLVDWCSLLNVNPSFHITIINTLRVVVGFICLQMIINVITSVIASYQKVALSSMFGVLGNILSLLGIYLLTKTCQPSLVLLGLVSAGAPLLVLIIGTIILYSTKFKEVSPSYKCINKSLIKSLFNLGAKFFLLQIQVIILFQTTNLLISNVSNPNEVTAYNIAYKYLSVALMIYTIILSPLWPAFTDAYTKKDFKWMKNIYIKMIYVYLLSAIALLIMTALSPWVYKLWVGSKAIIPLQMTISVAFYMLLFTWDSLQIQLINGIGKITLQTYVTLIGLVFHIPLALFLGKRVGAYGVVYSMSVITIIYISFFTLQLHKLLCNNAKGIWNR